MNLRVIILNLMRRQKKNYPCNVCVKTKQMEQKIFDKGMSIIAMSAGGAVCFSWGGEMLTWIGAIIGLGFGIYVNFKEPH